MLPGRVRFQCSQDQGDGPMDVLISLSEAKEDKVSAAGVCSVGHSLSVGGT